MSASKNAVVFLWTGKPIEDKTVKKIGELLINSGLCIPELMKARVYDQNGIFDTIVKEVSVNTEISKEELNPVKQSIIYIGERFKESLSNESNRVNFILELNTAIHDAQNALSFNVLSAHKEERALLNAVGIISRRSSEIPIDLAKSYHITNQVIDIIKQIYRKTV